MFRRRTATALTLVLAFGGCARSGGRIVLGSRQVVANGVVGWGTSEPREIFNGGVPNGKAWDLRWHNWGSPVAQGYGLTWIYRPHGGYFGKPAAVELRAYSVGRCSREGPRAYQHLKVREAIRPGGSLGRWVEWGGWPNLCHVF